MLLFTISTTLRCCLSYEKCMNIRQQSNWLAWLGWCWGGLITVVLGGLNGVIMGWPDTGGD